MMQTVLIAVALALDAFGVALGLGCSQRLKMREKASIILSFGVFQFLFSFIGAVLGNYINSNFFNITGVVSGVIILLLGILLLKEGFEHKEEDERKNFSLWTYVLLGISVSIDALGVGFSVLYKLNIAEIAWNAVIIGVIASGLTTVSFVVSNYIRNFSIVEKYADYLGGIILIIFGLKMMF